MGNREGSNRRGDRPGCVDGCEHFCGPDDDSPFGGGRGAPGAAQPVLRHLPQRAVARPGRRPVRLRRARRGARRGRPGGVGGSGPQAAPRHDAAGRPPPPGPGVAPPLRDVARVRARPRGRAGAVSGPARRAPPHIGRVRECDSGAPGIRGGRTLAAVPGRRRRPAGVRHERGCALRLPRPVRALPCRGQPHQPTRGRRPDDRAGLRRRHLRHPAAALSGRPRRRRSPVRLARRDGRSSLLPARRRLRGPHSAPPDDLRLHRRNGPRASNRGAS